MCVIWDDDKNDILKYTDIWVGVEYSVLFKENAGVFSPFFFELTLFL